MAEVEVAANPNVGSGHASSPTQAIDGRTGDGSVASSSTSSSSATAVEDPLSVPKAKHKAKRTSRARMIASLTGVDATVRSARIHEPSPPDPVQPDSSNQAKGKTKDTDPSPVATQQSPPSPALDSKTPHCQPTPPASTGQRSTSASLEDSEVCVVPSAVTMPAGSKTGQSSGTGTFDAAAFDALIYQQPSASSPPPGVLLSHTQRATQPPSVNDRVYIHANPWIHGMHNRSDEWHEAKAKEIQERGNRKFWFRKVAERRRWLRRRQRDNHLGRESGLVGSASDPQPWTYNRVIDFEHVPESQLPPDVQADPAWSRACAWFRQTGRARMLAANDPGAAERRREGRARGREITEAQTENHYRAVMARLYNARVDDATDDDD